MRVVSFSEARKHLKSVLDTADEVKMYNAGGMLQRFAKEFIEGTLDIV